MTDKLFLGMYFKKILQNTATLQGAYQRVIYVSYPNLFVTRRFVPCVS